MQSAACSLCVSPFPGWELAGVVWLARNRRQSWQLKVTWENKAEQATGSWPLACGVSHQAEPGQAGQVWSTRQDKTSNKIGRDKGGGTGGRVRWCRSGIDWGGVRERRGSWFSFWVRWYSGLQCEVPECEQSCVCMSVCVLLACCCCCCGSGSGSCSTVRAVSNERAESTESRIESVWLSGRAQTLRLRGRGDS